MLAFGIWFKARQGSIRSSTAIQDNEITVATQFLWSDDLFSSIQIVQSNRC